ncbi:hypothetical protein AWC38_SpisGene23524 [Stylophora pistillata]|uniref:SAP domain-containing protein n=1 Tax=Stylophora pistillata TaxID=50429 RepID=A0A2B4R821_STYPI|nr:hypothetical protein AWC38_SpisGene23524 [Stylophora pistillata]
MNPAADDTSGACCYYGKLVDCDLQIFNRQSHVVSVTVSRVCGDSFKWLSSSIMGGSPPKYYVNFRVCNESMSTAQEELKSTPGYVVNGEYEITDARHDSSRSVAHTTVSALSFSTKNVLRVVNWSRATDTSTVSRELPMTKELLTFLTEAQGKPCQLPCRVTVQAEWLPNEQEFSDDGAPETNELTMSIGSMVCWNFGDQVGATESVLCALKPIVCKQCNTRFADNLSLWSHLKFCNATELRSVAINPTLMTVPGLKEALHSRGLSTAGNKEILVKRLEGALAGEG